MNLRTISIALLAILAAALGVGATSASATVLEGANGEVHTGTIKAAAEGLVTLEGTVKITCNKSTLEGTVESHGSEVPVKGKVSSLTFSECGNSTVTVVKPGSLEVNHTSEDNGTLKSTGAELTTVTHNILGTVHCIYATNETAFGTFTGSFTTNAEATLDIVSKPSLQSTDFACSSEFEFSGNYLVTSPVGLAVAAAADKNPYVSVTSQVDFIKENETTPVVIINLSHTKIPELKVSFSPNGEKYFTRAKTCKELGVTGICEEEVTCGKGSGERWGTLYVKSTTPFVWKMSYLRCLN